mmetsp:Transcript_11357/g.43884  ORF Transcript_11357/g.43884 Transcript_11357/m.43884 type:complete len:242 (+) Transcript_11357:310-1035(+)
MTAMPAASQRWSQNQGQRRRAHASDSPPRSQRQMPRELAVRLAGRRRVCTARAPERGWPRRRRPPPGWRTPPTAASRPPSTAARAARRTARAGHQPVHSRARRLQRRRPPARQHGPWAALLPPLPTFGHRPDRPPPLQTPRLLRWDWPLRRPAGQRWSASRLGQRRIRAPGLSWPIAVLRWNCGAGPWPGRKRPWMPSRWPRPVQQILAPAWAMLSSKRLSRHPPTSTRVQECLAGFELPP